MGGPAVAAQRVSAFVVVIFKKRIYLFLEREEEVGRAKGRERETHADCTERRA